MGQKRNHKGNQKNLEINKNKNTTYHNFEDAVKAVVGGNFTAKSTLK